MTSPPPPRPTRLACRGFTLLEVMVSLAIIAIAFTAMLSSQAHNIELAAEAKFQTTAPLLAQEVISRLRAVGGAATGPDHGDWGADFAGYRWQRQPPPSPRGLDPEVRDLLLPLEITVTWQDQARYTYQQRGYLFNPPTNP